MYKFNTSLNIFNRLIVSYLVEFQRKILYIFDFQVFTIFENYYFSFFNEVL
jgi:hypothetical protein